MRRGRKKLAAASASSARLDVSSAGEVAGSVSGGCVESAVVQVAQDVLRSGIPRVVRYSISDEQAFGVGLTCGGTLEVFVEPLGGDDAG